MRSSGLNQSGRAISDAYFRNGCLVNQHGAAGLPMPAAAVNQHAVFDAMRRWSQWIRIVSRFEFVGYAVENGKSILWFRRRAVFTGQDIWSGIADEIAATAPDAGLTNRWVLDVDLIPYSPSLSSIWKPGAFADYWAQFNRCTFGSPAIGHNQPLLWHGALGQSSGGENLMSEFPSGYNYAKLDNPSPYYGDYISDGASADHFKSCRLYEPPVEIESAVTEQRDGEPVVKITLTARLHNTNGEPGGAPSSVAEDISTWNEATIAAEPYRTAENGLRLYLLNMATAYNPTAIAGDRAYNCGLPSNNPYAAIYPRFGLTRLVPEPKADQDSEQDPEDTPLWSDVLAYAETILRATCEGWIDIEKTADELCDYYNSHSSTMPTDWRPSAFTWENLCYRAFNRPWMTLAPTTATTETPAEKTRSEGPLGFGPAPNTEVSSELFNQLAAAVDLLDTVRVMLPYEIQEWRTYQDNNPPASVTAGITCGGYDWWFGTPPAVDRVTLDDGAYGAMSGSYLEAYTFAQLCASGTQMKSYIDTVQYRHKMTSLDALNAVPTTWRDMLDTATGSFWVVETITQRWTKPPTLPACTGESWESTTTTECQFLTSGTLSAGALQRAWYRNDYAGCGDSAMGQDGASVDIVATPISLVHEVCLRVPLVDVIRM